MGRSSVKSDKVVKQEPKNPEDERVAAIRKDLGSAADGFSDVDILRAWHETGKLKEEDLLRGIFGSHIEQSIRVEGLNVRDGELIETLFPKMTAPVMATMTDYFIGKGNVRDTSGFCVAPSKWSYSNGSDFDTLVLNGCPCCGQDYNFLGRIYKKGEELQTLQCEGCGHSAAPLHYESEQDAWARRKMGGHLKDINAPVRGAVYHYGMRESYRFNDLDKKWWRNHFLPKQVQAEEIDSIMSTMKTMGSLKGQVVHEQCDKCENDKAYYHTFQARSADEGSTIMYECTECGSRKVFNN